MPRYYTQSEQHFEDQPIANRAEATPNLRLGTYDRLVLKSNHHFAEDDLFDFCTKLVVIVALAATIAHSGRLLWIAYVLRSVGAG